uniref:NADH-ubiquinone oxidoreductase chain 5 n=1 Tax=Plotocnide borealis TaxID=1755686 RepID=A0A0S2IBD3_9CNID|nr:NADH dehydrogenase subunit 5 [Plotocnide borealis]
MLFWIIILPLLSSIICGLCGRWLGDNGAKELSCNCILYSVYISLWCYFQIILNNSIIIINLWCWFDLGLLNSQINLRFDNLVCFMLILITIVSYCVHLFSTSYMAGDPHLSRFMSYLSLFTFFMIILVTSSNLIQLFIGWEGVGLCSYLLINFWISRLQANKSAIKAMIINKIGDMALLLSIILIWINIGSIEFNEIFLILNYFNNIIVLNIIGLLLLIGVIGKSAQIGLHMWLPDAMEGPTPVSALIHAATMVTAGVFLIIRMSPLFEKIPFILLIITLIGSLTAFIASSIGLIQNDLKKIIAYSTCSQLGYMVMICGFSYYSLSLFHLINHGFFKALLFLSAGSIIHSFSNEQDIRKMGGSKYLIPIAYIFIVVGSLSLMGLPFLTGFYSKDLILEIIFSQHKLKFAFWFGLIAVLFTAIYSTRLIFYTFFIEPQKTKSNLISVHEGDLNIIKSLIILFISSIIVGYFLKFSIFQYNFPVPISNNIKLFPLVLTCEGIICALIFGLLLYFKWVNKLKIKYRLFYNILIYLWYFDSIINNYIIKPLFNIGSIITYKLIDNQILEVLGPYGVYNNININSNLLSKFHLGKISVYILFFIIFILFFLFNN